MFDISFHSLIKLTRKQGIKIIKNCANYDFHSLFFSLRNVTEKMVVNIFKELAKVVLIVLFLLLCLLSTYHSFFAGTI